MVRIKNIFLVLRNHPKKFVFFSGLTALGYKYAEGKYEEGRIMEQYCKEAMMYGDKTQLLLDVERHITVILNPASNRGKGKANFEKYCAPLLHLAGLKVAIVRTENEGQAKELMQVMDNTTAVVVAGGDGTLLEVLTGLFRRADSYQASKRFPLGLLPLGEKNTTFCKLWGLQSSIKAKQYADATMAIINSVVRPLDVMEITPVQESEEDKSKPIYASSFLQWGAFRDADDRKDAYWYWPFIKKYVTYIFSSYKDLNWDCSAEVLYSMPCSGCSNCRKTPDTSVLKNENLRWWQKLVMGIYSSKKVVENLDESTINYSEIKNDECGKLTKIVLDKPSEIIVSTCNETPCIPSYSLSVQLGPKNINFIEFIKEGWLRTWTNDRSYKSDFLAGQICLKPLKEMKDSRGKDRELSINNETFEVKEVHIRILPDAAHIFGPARSSLK